MAKIQVMDVGGISQDGVDPNALCAPFGCCFSVTAPSLLWSSRFCLGGDDAGNYGITVTPLGLRIADVPGDRAQKITHDFDRNRFLALDKIIKIALI
jgi:hypothetical protein